MKTKVKLHYNEKQAKIFNKFYLTSGRVICKDGKELFSIHRILDDNSNGNFFPCECDAVSHFIIDALNNGNFEQYYSEYMK